jgi:hypothetical protein
MLSEDIFNSTFQKRKVSPKKLVMSSSQKSEIWNIPTGESVQGVSVNTVQCFSSGPTTTNLLRGRFLVVGENLEISSIIEI